MFTIIPLRNPPDQTASSIDIPCYPLHLFFLGDFNVHCLLFGKEMVNTWGKVIENFIAQTNLCILNNMFSTGMFDTTSVDLRFYWPEMATFSRATLDKPPPHRPLSHLRNLNLDSGPSYFMFCLLLTAHLILILDPQTHYRRF